MKKYLFFAAVALVALASCSDETLVAENSPNMGGETGDGGAIVFNSGTKTITRADHVGADAANLLNKKFYVVAFKGDGSSSMSQTFDNYLVEWTENTAGTTTSNTSDWEYVGQTAPAWSGITGNKQTIKYWDYSNTQYDFIAWSPGTATAVPAPDGPSTPPSGTVQIGKPTANTPYAPTYTLKGSRDDLAKCYIADMVTAYKEDKTPVQPKYQEEVKFTFRNLACKVRMALYETVPGYSVKDVKFYTDNSTSLGDGATEDNANLFTSGSEDYNKFYTAGTYTVSFPTKGASSLNETDYNKAHVAFVATGSDTKEDFGALNKVGKEYQEADATNYLGRTLPTASYAGVAPYYKTMLPNETGTVLELRVDYTLLATDGSTEEIKIHGAKAFVPLIYTQWKPNYAYTYIFKISDNTNGWTSTVTDDPAGLFPITFDAIVVDAEEYQQNTITTVATPSITTYQKGHNPSIDGSVIGIDEYDKGNGNIFVQVMKDGTLATDLNTVGISKLYTLTGKTSYTEADVMDALNIQASVSGSTITGRNGVVLTQASITNDITAIPGVNGNDITVVSGTAAEFTPAAGTYAYVYDTKTYGGQKYTAQPAGFPTGYYTDAACESAASTFTTGTVYYKMQSFISSYVELSSAPSDWKTDATNPYYSDEACTTQITGTYANTTCDLTTGDAPSDWNASDNVYYSDATCTTQVNSAFTNGTYYKKLTCYKKFIVNNKIYGVKVIKVV